MSPVAPRSRLPKRPWYLVASLVAGWLLGANAMSEGCQSIQYYRGETINIQAPTNVTDVEARQRIIELSQKVIGAMDAARSRLLPIGVALLVLGAAMVMLSARAMSGRPGARGALVQITLARAAVILGGYFVAADVRANETALASVATVALMREQPQHPETKQLQETLERTAAATARAMPLIELVGSSLVSLFVVIALTRQRSREFFEAAAGPLSEG
jgi:hypothetical protein